MKMRHLVALIVLVCASLFSSHPALAQFSQQGPKLVGTGAVGGANQGRRHNQKGENFSGKQLKFVKGDFG